MSIERLRKVRRTPRNNQEVIELRSWNVMPDSLMIRHNQEHFIVWGGDQKDTIVSPYLEFHLNSLSDSYTDSVGTHAATEDEDSVRVRGFQLWRTLYDEYQVHSAKYVVDTCSRDTAAITVCAAQFRVIAVESDHAVQSFENMAGIAGTDMAAPTIGVE